MCVRRPPTGQHYSLKGKGAGPSLFKIRHVKTVRKPDVTFFLLFTPKEIILIYICKYKEDTVYLHKRVTVMVTLTNYTREEFIDIFKKAKTRKAEWQKQAERELREMSERIANNKARVKSR